MAPRETLLEFQARLSQRLQAAQASGERQGAWLAVNAGGHACLLPLDQAGEIQPAGHCQPLPYVQPWLLGVANLRGRLHTVVDLGAYLAREPGWPAPAMAAGPAGAPVAEAHWVTLAPRFELPCALQVSQLAGLRQPADFAGAPIDPGHAGAVAGHGHRDAAGLVWQVLDLSTLSQAPRFLAVGTP